jgi:hypothetical protein
MEVRMPRQFGLTMKSTMAPLDATGESGQRPIMLVTEAAAPVVDPPVGLAALTLPYAPASWRGSGKRRSVSID